MALVYRLIVLLLLLAAGSAHALVPVQSGWRAYRQFDSQTVAEGFGATKQIACDAAIARFMQLNSQYGNYVLNSKVNDGVNCSATMTPGGTYAFAIVAASSCPANSTAVSGGCQCATGYQENATKTACEVPPPECQSLAGQSAGMKSWEAGSSDGSPRAGSFSFCDGWNPKGGGKCVAKAEREFCGVYDGRWICQGAATYTGAQGSTCNGSGGDAAPSKDSTPPGEPAPDKPKEGEAAPSPCPKGQQPGTVNGTRVCAPTGEEDPKTGNDSKETKNPDGSTVRESSESRCRDGKCTTDTTKCTKAAGSSTETCSTTTTTQGQGTLCATQKGSNVCSGSGEGTPTQFGGTCAAGFKAVSDDAVINAMAEETFRQNCKVNPDADSQVLAKAEMVKTGDQTLNNPNNSTVSISQANFDTSNALGGASACPADRVVALPMGRSFTLRMSSVCGSLEMLGAVMLAFSFLLGARIVARG